MLTINEVVKKINRKYLKKELNEILEQESIIPEFFFKSPD